MNVAVPTPARGRAASFKTLLTVLFPALVALPLALPLDSAGFSLLSQLASIASRMSLVMGWADFGLRSRAAARRARPRACRISGASKGEARFRIR